MPQPWALSTIPSIFPKAPPSKTALPLKYPIDLHSLTEHPRWMQHLSSVFLYSLKNLNRGQKRCKNNSSHDASKKYDKERIQNLPDRVNVPVELPLQQIRQAI